MRGIKKIETSSRTTEGLPGECRVCGKMVWIEPSMSGDAVCVHCGSLVWLNNPMGEHIDYIRRLADLGFLVSTDDQGEITKLSIVGPQYNDALVPKLVALDGIRFIDFTQSGISMEGAAKLRELLPNTIIKV